MVAEAFLPQYFLEFLLILKKNSEVNLENQLLVKQFFSKMRPSLRLNSAKCKLFVLPFSYLATPPLNTSLPLCRQLLRRASRPRANQGKAILSGNKWFVLLSCHLLAASKTKSFLLSLLLAQRNVRIKSCACACRPR